MAKVRRLATSAACRLYVISFSFIMYNYMYKEKIMPMIVHFDAV